MTASPQPRPILVADDDANDLFLLRRRLDKAGVKHPLVTFGNGADLVSYLRAHVVQGSLAEAEWPCLVLLDLKMPRFDGFQVLEWMHSQQTLKELPVVVLSGSDLPQDIERARELGAAAYFTKPPAVEALGKLVRELAARG